MASILPALSIVQSTNPATGEIVARFDCTPAGALPGILRRARDVQAGWAASSLSSRCDLLRKLGRVLHARRDELAQLVTRETGKPIVEALFADVLISLEVAKYYAHDAPYALQEERVPHQNFAVKAKSGHLAHQPLGVIAVISPWNYPLAIPLGQIIPAVVAGNAVVLKPSEFAPGCGHIIADCFAEAGFPAKLVQVIHGGGELGAAFVDARPDKVVFTGSTAAGRRVAEACARHLIPSVLELGGKDAMIVLADARLEAASSAAVWGAFTNAGQACLSIERIFVERSVAEAFTERVVAKTRQLRLGPGSNPDNEIGPLIYPQAVERIEMLLQSAVAAGVRVLTGGKRRPELGPCYFEPTVLTNVTPTMPIMREPIFGPVVAIHPVPGVEEAVALTNDCAYGLAASIWTASGERGSEIAKRIRPGIGTVMINDLASYFGIPEAPHGGGGLSGWGRTHSRIGLLEMLQVRYTDVDWLPRQPKAWWFGYNRALAQLAGQFINFSHAPEWRRRCQSAFGTVRALFRGHRI
jgi:succinate-semialdehyde dehydrogenase/glutarate-semialdehyde dehydrogenase